MAEMKPDQRAEVTRLALEAGVPTEFFEGWVEGEELGIYRQPIIGSAAVAASKQAGCARTITCSGRERSSPPSSDHRAHSLVRATAHQRMRNGAYRLKKEKTALVDTWKREPKRSVKGAMFASASFRFIMPNFRIVPSAPPTKSSCDIAVM